MWQVHFNLIPIHRASFKRWVAKWNPMHTGTSSGTFAHELGHYLGLDDEYGESQGAKKDCETLYAKADQHYIMCDSESGRAGAMGFTRGSSRGVTRSPTSISARRTPTATRASFAMRAP